MQVIILFNHRKASLLAQMLLTRNIHTFKNIYKQLFKFTQKTGPLPNQILNLEDIDYKNLSIVKKALIQSLNSTQQFERVIQKTEAVGNGQKPLILYWKLQKLFKDSKSPENINSNLENFENLLEKILNLPNEYYRYQGFLTGMNFYLGCKEHSKLLSLFEQRHQFGENHSLYTYRPILEYYFKTKQTQNYGKLLQEMEQNGIEYKILQVNQYLKLLSMSKKFEEMIATFDANLHSANVISYSILFDGLGYKKDPNRIGFYQKTLAEKTVDENLLFSIIEAYLRCDQIFTGYEVYKKMVGERRLQNPKKIYRILTEFIGFHKQQDNLLEDVKQYFLKEYPQVLE